MEDLNELIQYENESTRLDFKAVQYAKPMYEALLKDLMAMANANVTGDRYIIIGVKHRSDGTRELSGIAEADFVDSATYHQLVRENIEPEIHFEYKPYRVDGVLLGIFHLYDCTNPPYMMRKKYGQGLHAGDAYIRKGSHQARLTRPDIDRMVRNRSDAGFSGVLRIGFDAPGAPDEITLPAVGTIKLPSQEAANKIRAILAEREKAAADPTHMSLQHRMIGFRPLGSAFGPIPYASRTDDELRKNLQNVQETYKEHDLYAVYEENAARINLMLMNEGTSYVENASIRVLIPKIEGLLVAPRIYHKPESDNLLASLSVRPSENLQYPHVRSSEDHFEITAEIGDMRHGIPARAFRKPLRIVLGNPLVGTAVRLECTVFGKQLREPRTKTLSILVSPRNT